MSELQGVYAIWLREVLVFFKEKERVISSLVTPLLWLVVLGFGLGGSVEIGDTKYSEFIFPGIIAMNVLFVSLFYGMYVVWDRKLDFLKEVLVAPIRRSSLVLGKILGGVTDVAIQTSLLFIIGSFILGYSLSITAALLAYSIALYMAICIVSIGLTIGASLSGPEGFNLIVSFVMWPMFLLSGALFPVENVPPWLRPFVYIDPLFYGVDLLRHVMGGVSVLPPLVNVVALGTITLLSFIVATLSFRRL